ncbi:MAG: c-type cytochrome [Planctomycetes bacterium]|nr:c-type cytochrome [Planctomycetota bacterium]
MIFALLLLAVTVTAPAVPVVTAHNLKVPPGFSARLYADNDIAPDITTMTIDDGGRVLVAGPGYVRALFYNAITQAPTTAFDLIDGLKQAPMGLFAEGDSLYVVVDGGLKRYRGYDGSSKLKNPETLLALKTGGEHDAHAVRRGPDGWLYLLCGNMAGVKKDTIKGTRSPVKEPTAGALLRLSPDFKQVEVVADGFRNPYSFDFNLDGEPFTYDSDNERCVGLPWYEGCRFYHVLPGGNYGWRSPQLSQTWRKPAYFPDVVPPICDTGRGSPTGVACYRHTHFPPIYRGDFLLADWTFGRIYWVMMKPHGASFVGKHEVFAEATGTSGFAPTALAIHPQTGELFVSSGGRGTRGGVYAIRYNKGGAKPKPVPMATPSLDFDKDRPARWLAECNSDNPRTRRVALEAIARWWNEPPWGKRVGDAVKPNLTHDDEYVRRAAARLGSMWHVELGTVSDQRAKLHLALEQAKTDPEWALKLALATLEDKKADGPDLLLGLRVVQLAAGDLTAPDAMGTAWEGYTFRAALPKVYTARIVAALYLHVDRSGLGFDREISLESARVVGALTGVEHRDVYKLTTALIDRKTRYQDDFHYYLALTRGAQNARDWRSDGLANGLFAMLDKVKQDAPLLDRHWPLRLAELVGGLSTVTESFDLAVIEHRSFGAPEHALFTGKLEPRAKVAEKFLKVAKSTNNYAWNAAAVELLAALPRDMTLAALEQAWERPGLQDAVIRALAHDPHPDDRPKFLAGLKALDPDVVRLSARALVALPAQRPADVYAPAVHALRRFPDEKPFAPARAALVDLLQKASGEKIGPDAKAWTAWAVKQDPKLEAALTATAGYDAKAWEKRLAGIDWAKGDAARGKLAFAKATCAACHDGGRAVGPSLLGITKRFGRDDLLTSILQPSKDVSARYRPTQVLTKADTIFTGVIVYEAADGVILQTGADTTIRIAGADIASKRVVDTSLMPAGLLDKLTDAEIADLLAYLGTLK